MRSNHGATPAPGEEKCLCVDLPCGRSILATARVAPAIQRKTLPNQGTSWAPLLLGEDAPATFINFTLRAVLSNEMTSPPPTHTHTHSVLLGMQLTHPFVQRLPVRWSLSSRSAVCYQIGCLGVTGLVLKSPYSLHNAPATRLFLQCTVIIVLFYCCCSSSLAVPNI